MANFGDVDKLFYVYSDRALRTLDQFLKQGEARLHKKLQQRMKKVSNLH